MGGKGLLGWFLATPCVSPGKRQLVSFKSRPLNGMTLAQRISEASGMIDRRRGRCGAMAQQPKTGTYRSWVGTLPCQSPVFVQNRASVVFDSVVPNCEYHS